MSAYDEFDQMVGALNYPMFVVTTTDGERRAGCLVGFTSQVSINPARFFVCLSDKNYTYRVARQADTLVVHVLRRNQHDVAELFGSETGDNTDKFAHCDWRPGPGGAPVLNDCAGWFAGRILERARLGDHVGHLIEPYDGAVHGLDGGLLTFRDVQDLDPGHEA